MPTPTAHARCSASSAHRFLNCTAAPTFEAQFPPSEGSVYTREGTLAHDICELTVRHKLLGLDDSSFDFALKARMENELYNPEMIDTAAAYVEHIETLYGGYSSTPILALEQRVSFTDYVPEGFGTCDCMIMGDDRLCIVDYKHGKGVRVEVERNPQLMLYALGALQTFEPIYGDTLKQISLSIVQPRISANPSVWETSVEELRQWGDRIRPKAIAAYHGPGSFNPGEWCRWCAGSAVCRARAEQATAFADFAGLANNKLTGDEIGDLIRLSDTIADWVKDIRAYALEELKSGRPIKGFKLVEGRSNRAFDDTDAAFKTLIEAGYDEALLYDREPKTLAAIEKVVGKKRFGEIMGSHIVKPAGKPTLAPMSDARDELNSAVRDFKDVK